MRDAVKDDGCQGDAYREGHTDGVEVSVPALQAAYDQVSGTESLGRRLATKAPLRTESSGEIASVAGRNLPPLANFGGSLGVKSKRIDVVMIGDGSSR